MNSKLDQITAHAIIENKYDAVLSKKEHELSRALAKGLPKVASVESLVSLDYGLPSNSTQGNYTVTLTISWDYDPNFPLSTIQFIRTGNNTVVLKYFETDSMHFLEKSHLNFIFRKIAEILETI